MQKYINTKTRTQTRARTHANTRIFTNTRIRQKTNSFGWIRSRQYGNVNTMTRVFNSHMIHNHHYTSNAHAATESTELPTNTLIAHTVFQEWDWDWEQERASKRERERKMEWQKNRTNYTLTSIVSVCMCVCRKPFAARQPNQNSKSNSNRAYKKLLSSSSSRLPSSSSLIPFQFLLLLLLDNCCCRFVFVYVLYFIAFTIFTYIVFDFLVVPASLLIAAVVVTYGQFFFLSSQFSPFNFNFDIGFSANHSII